MRPGVIKQHKPNQTKTHYFVVTTISILGMGYVKLNLSYGLCQVKTNDVIAVKVEHDTQKNLLSYLTIYLLSIT